MLIVMAVDAQQLPVAAVGRIVFVVVVLVVDREIAQRLAAELAPAPAADPGIDFERFLPIGLRSFFLRALGLGEHIGFGWWGHGVIGPVVGKWIIVSSREGSTGMPVICLNFSEWCFLLWIFLMP